MKTFAVVAALSLISLTACATMEKGEPLARPASATSYATAVANPARSDELRALDASRKPAETLAFLGLEPGMDAADLMTGAGYWAQIMASVVGPKGSVTAFESNQFYKGDGAAKLDALIAATPGATLKTYPFEAFAAPARSFDFALMNLNYHDLYWQSEKYGIPRTDPDAFVRNLYTAMRPGGIVGIIDHVGPAGDTRAIVDKMHRIDPAVVKADFERAGFRLAARSDLLANPADDHTLSVFDKAIRGNTDRFLYKFVKPR